jgi:hypothetical protein
LGQAELEQLLLKKYLQPYSKFNTGEKSVTISGIIGIQNYKEIKLMVF